VLSGRGLCDEPITRPEESYRLWCVVVCDLETSGMRRPWPTVELSSKNKQTMSTRQSVSENRLGGTWDKGVTGKHNWAKNCLKCNDIYKLIQGFTVQLVLRNTGKTI